MQDDAFEWDDAKAAANPRNHRGVTFNQARAVFRDPLAKEVFDDREDYGEDRLNIIGRIGAVILHVTYTWRGQRRRIISARPAERHEIDEYFRQTGNKI